MHWEQVWKFETKLTRVVFEVTPCQDDPADHFDDNGETASGIESGKYAWFDCRVRVFANGSEIAADYLSCCCYNDVQEFVTSHRDANPMNRNSSIMRKANGDNVVICHYFPGMVTGAVKEARKRILELPAIRHA